MVRVGHLFERYAVGDDGFGIEPASLNVINKPR